MASLEHTQKFSEIPLLPRAAGCPVPLTPIQLLAWDYLMKEANLLSVRIPTAAFRVLGPLNTGCLQRSIEAVVGRHESLRTRFVVIDGSPTHQIDAAREYPLQTIDLSGVTPKESIDTQAKQIVMDIMNERIDLSSGPLFEAKLLRFSNNDHVLVLAIDHMITDGVSNRILIADIWALYKQFARGLPSALPKLPVQFADFAVWQHRTYDSWKARHEEYWRKRLAGAPRIELPFEHRQQTLANVRGAAMHWSFGSALSAKLRELARRQRTLLSLVVLAIYVVVMSMWCAETDLVLTFATHGRYHRELQQVIGFLAVPLHLRIEITKEDTYFDLLGKLSAELNAGHCHYDSGRVLDLVPAENRMKMFFNWGRQSIHDRIYTDGELTIQPFPIERDWKARFATLFYETETGVGCTVNYRPDVLALSTVEQFCESMRIVAEKFAQNPGAHVASIPIKLSRKANA